MRTKSFIKNLIFSLGYEALLIVMGLILPKLIITTYGSEVNGLTSTINQILVVINLLQAGAVGASIYQMYSPIANNDQEKINEIMSSSKRYFQKLGLIYLLAIFIICPFFAFFKGGQSLRAVEIGIAFALLGINGSINFFFFAWYDILFSSSQRRYFLSIAGMVEKLLYYALVLIVILTKQSFMLMYVCVLVGSIAKIAVLFWLYLKKSTIKVKYTTSRFTIDNRGALLINSVARQFIGTVPVIVVGLFSEFSVASILSVYLLVHNLLVVVENSFQNSIGEIFGNLVASSSSEKIGDVYTKVEYLFFALGFILCTCSSALFLPFVNIYTNQNSFDTNYLFMVLPILIVMFNVFYVAQQSNLVLLDSHGKFKEFSKQSIICAIIGTAISVIAHYIYWPLTFIGPIAFYILLWMYREYISKKVFDWYNVYKSVIYVILTAATSFGMWYISIKLDMLTLCNSWVKWLLGAIVTASISLAILLLYSIIFEREKVISFKRYIKQVFKK